MAESKWEIRKSGIVFVESSVKNCGYTDDQLLSMRKAGYRLYRDGKAVK